MLYLMGFWLLSFSFKTNANEIRISVISTIQERIGKNHVRKISSFIIVYGKKKFILFDNNLINKLEFIKLNLSFRIFLLILI